MKVLIVDDHVLIREALKSVLGAILREPRVIEAWLASQALQLVRDHPDVELILLDLVLPDRDGLSVLRELRESHPGIAIVVLSARQDRQDIAEAIGMGASGYIPKSASREVMVSALNLIFAGGIYVPPEVFASAPAQLAPGTSADRKLPPARALGLTPRQHEVLALMLQGKSNKAICRSLDLAEPTVKNHVSAILKALNATSRTEAVIAANALMTSAVNTNRP